jgi:zinc/manganese transport system permease protein
VLFGTVLALDDATLALLVGTAIVSLMALAVLYRPLVLECLDPQFLRSVSRLSALTHYGFLVLMVINLVAGFHALGTLMAVGIMVLPAATARLWVRSVPALMVLASALALAACVAGLLLSYHVDWPTSPTIVLALGAAYLVSLVAGRFGAWRLGHSARRHLRG